jgi:DNA invertase Pin-like site-specific DNA recombinase
VFLGNNDNYIMQMGTNVDRKQGLRTQQANKPLISWDEFAKQKVTSMYKSGLSQSGIARQLGIGRTSVRRILNSTVFS